MPLACLGIAFLIGLYITISGMEGYNFSYLSLKQNQIPFLNGPFIMIVSLVILIPASITMLWGSDDRKNWKRRKKS